MEVSMSSAQMAVQLLPCDGCGQAASSEHIARRLRRLELTTRYRPIHVQAVFLGAQSPQRMEEFLYGAEAEFGGEGAKLLSALEIEHVGRAVETVLAEFQRKGFLLTHVMECEADDSGSADALKKKLPSVLKRLRTSLRSKRVVIFSQAMAPLVSELRNAQFGGELVLDGNAPFDLENSESVMRLRSML